mgnify:FL=1
MLDKYILQPKGVKKKSVLKVQEMFCPVRTHADANCGNGSDIKMNKMRFNFARF